MSCEISLDTLLQEPVLSAGSRGPSPRPSTPPFSPPAIHSIHKRKRSIAGTSLYSCPTSPSLPPQIRVVLPGTNSSTNLFSTLATAATFSLRPKAIPKPQRRLSQTPLPLAQTQDNQELTALKTNQTILQTQIFTLQEQNKVMQHQILHLLSFIPQQQQQQQQMFTSNLQNQQIPQTMIDPLLRVDSVMGGNDFKKRRNVVDSLDFLF
ncbi:UNVERIFIED_CONTAM: hypothetical protein HDU68_008442 [Siphonaria sp. JEL0065]|nr:hypothetical protein HDU68_008442 [Siphonaria sp. JEL0065]